MGREVTDKEYNVQDFERFNSRIHNQVDILKKIIANPEFGSQNLCIGAELELYLMDEKSDVSPVNLKLLEMLNVRMTRWKYYQLHLKFYPFKKISRGIY